MQGRIERPDSHQKEIIIPNVVDDNATSICAICTKRAEEIRLHKKDR